MKVVNGGQAEEMRHSISHSHTLVRASGFDPQWGPLLGTLWRALTKSRDRLLMCRQHASLSVNNLVYIRSYMKKWKSREIMVYAQLL